MHVQIGLGAARKGNRMESLVPKTLNQGVTSCYRVLRFRMQRFRVEGCLGCQV